MAAKGAEADAMGMLMGNNVPHFSADAIQIRSAVKLLIRQKI